MALRPSALFFLPNTTTLLARSAINLLKSVSEAVLNEAITTIQNRSLAPPAVMTHLEQNVHVAEVLEKLAKEWTPETLRAFSAAFNMDGTKTDVMDAIVGIAILNEADLEAELRGENTPETTASDLLENRRITWQYPPPGTLLNPPYLVLVAVEHVDTSKADSEVQTILGELVDYKGFRIPQRASAPLRIRPGLLSDAILAGPSMFQVAAVEQPAAVPAAPEAPGTAPFAGVTQPATSLAGGLANQAAVTTAIRKSSRLFAGIGGI